MGLLQTVESKNKARLKKKQTLQVEVNNQFLFDLTYLGCQLSVLLNGNGTFSVAAGIIYGDETPSPLVILNAFFKA